MALSETIDQISLDKLRRILETDTLTIDELEAAISATNDPQKLALLLAALERLQERVDRAKRSAEERLANAPGPGDESTPSP